MCAEKERAYAGELLGKARAAATAFAGYDQEQVDRIVEAVFEAAFDARIELAEAAMEETFLGDLKTKVQKNVFASLIVYRDIRHEKTVGIVSEDSVKGTFEVAHPVGPVLSLTPITNPTSTVVNKALLCLKTRNPVIFSPHKAAKKCSRKAAQVVYDAARKAGAPEDCIQWSAKSKWSYTQALMHHPDVALILATSAFQVVKEAHRSGNPVLGAGEGNVPVFIDRSADAGKAAQAVIDSKTFDNSTVCCSEQALVVDGSIDGALRAALQSRGAHFCSHEEIEKLGCAVFDQERKVMRSVVVGQPAVKIAEKAGFSVPETTRVLIAVLEEVGPEVPLSHEILAPVLAYYTVPDREAGLEMCLAVARHRGNGHTLSLHGEDQEALRRFALAVPSGRILINTPSSLGGLGGTFNRLHPSLTLSCGGSGGNYSTDNITIRHLLNICRVAPRDVDPVWEQIGEDDWLDPGFDAKRLKTLF